MVRPAGAAARAAAGGAATAGGQALPASRGVPWMVLGEFAFYCCGVGDLEFFVFFLGWVGGGVGDLEGVCVFLVGWFGGLGLCLLGFGVRLGRGHEGVWMPFPHIVW